MSKKNFGIIMISILLFLTVLFFDQYIRTKTRFEEEISGLRCARFYCATVSDVRISGEEYYITINENDTEYTLITDYDYSIKKGSIINVHSEFCYDNDTIQNGWGSFLFPITYIEIVKE